MTATCVRRSAAGIMCCEPAVVYLDGQALCALHAQEVALKKKGKKRGRN